jgi:shikimate kinase
MNIVLIGFMGTGKTAVGKRLAKRLGWRFVDIDEHIEHAAGMPIARLFAERGEAVFRRLERRFISRAIHDRHQVIATGGGAFVDPQNRARLRATGPVICLTARPRVIVERVGRRPETRPLLVGGMDPLGRIRALLAQRERAYAQADLTVDTSQRSVDEVVEQLWERLSPCLCRGWQYLLDHTEELAERYGGKYVVVVGDRIAGSGDTQLKAYRNARLGREASGKREAGIYYIPLPEESLTAL